MLTPVWLTCALACTGFAGYGIHRAVQLWHVAPLADEWMCVAFYRAWIDGTVNSSSWLPSTTSIAFRYGAVLFNAFELGENMRFRIAVTPVNIALTFGLLAVLVKAILIGGRASR